MSNFKFFPKATMILSILSFVCICITVAAQNILSGIYMFGDNDVFVIPYLTLIISLLEMIAVIILMRKVMTAATPEGAQTAAIIYVGIIIAINIIFARVAAILEANIIASQLGADGLAKYSIINSVAAFLGSPLRVLSSFAGCVVLGITITYKKMKSDLYV